MSRRIVSKPRGTTAHLDMEMSVRQALTDLCLRHGLGITKMVEDLIRKQVADEGLCGGIAREVK